MSEPQKWPQHGPDFNAWNDKFDEFAALLESVKADPWWISDFGLKYLNIRVDTRDNGFLLLTEDWKERISPDRVVVAIDKFKERFKSDRQALADAEGRER